MLAVLKTFLSKYILEVVPSVVASVLGAYIVTHYINAKPEDKSAAVPAISATVSDPTTKGPKVAAEKAKPAEAKPDDVKSAEAKSSDDGKASDRADAGSAKDSDAAATADARQEMKSEAKADPKVDLKRASPALRGSVTKDAAREKPSKPVETANAPQTDDTRDINELARQALDRVRVAPEASRPAEAQAAPQPSQMRPVTAPVQSAAAPATAPAYVQPLPPPVMVSAPAADEPPAVRTGSVPSQQARADRPTPPADIPPLDLQASMAAPKVRDNSAQDPSVTDNVLSAAKSVFHAVIPQ